MASPTSYQRVTTATDYDATVGRYYLKFDGIDDSLATASIDFSAGDKMFVCAGVRKLSDAANGMLVELSANADSTNGSFALGAPIPTNDYYLSLKGTVTNSARGATGFDAPITSVLTAAYKLSESAANEQSLRVNASPVALLTASGLPGPAGAGNFAANPLYIGSRAGTSLPFNGHLYSLIVRGAQSTDAQIVSAEQFVAGKTGVVL